eukprot:c17828_g1_i1 orf=97-1029(+)
MRASRAGKECAWVYLLTDPSHWSEKRLSKVSLCSSFLAASIDPSFLGAVRGRRLPARVTLREKNSACLYVCVYVAHSQPVAKQICPLWMKHSYNPSQVSRRLLKEGFLHALQPIYGIWPQRLHTISENGDQHRQINTYACPSKIPALQKALPSLRHLGLPPRSILDFTHLLQKCGKERDRPLAFRLHGYMRENGLEMHKSLGNYLIPMLVDVGNMCVAQEVFDRFAYCNEWSWNSLINGYIKCGKPQQALDLYQKMQESGSVKPNGHTFVAAIRACAKLNDLEQGASIHAEVAKIGLLERNVFVGNTLID